MSTRADIARSCPSCGQPLIRHAGERRNAFEVRTFCSRACAGQAGHQARTAKAAARYADLIEDVEWLLGTDSPQRIAARLGYEHPASLERRLERAGRRDLADHFRESVAA